MDFGVLKDIFLWCTVVNYGILMVWFIAFIFAKSVMFDIHTKWFKLSSEEFDSIHYRGMAYYKIGVLLLNLSPYLALLIVG